MSIKELSANLSEKYFWFFICFRGFLFLNIVGYLADRTLYHQPLIRVVAWFFMTMIGGLPAGIVLTASCYLIVTFIGLSYESFKEKRYLEAIFIIIWLILIFSYL